MSVDEYLKLTATYKNIIDLLSKPEADRVEFEAAGVSIIIRPADLS